MNQNLKEEKVYNHSELPHLRLPPSLRQYFRQRGAKLKIGFKSVKVKMPNSNYVRPTKIITMEHIEAVEKDSTGIQRPSLKEVNIHNARCYLLGNYKDILSISKRNIENLEEQSLIMGHSRSWLNVHKYNNSLFYRYLRFIGKGNFIKARNMLNYEMNKLKDNIFDSQEKFKHEIYFAKLIAKAYEKVYSKKVYQQNIKKTLDDIFISIDCGIILYKRAKEINRLMKEIDYESLDYDVDGLYSIKEK